MKAKLRWSAFIVVALIHLASCTNGKTLNKNYQEMLVIKQHIWLLTNAGKIEVYTTDGHPQHLPLVESVIAQHLAVDGDCVVAQVGPTVQRWNNETGNWETMGKLTRNIFGLVVNSQHQLFAITDLGVLNVKTGYCKMPASSPNHQLRQLTSFNKPATYFLDSQDNLWIGFGYGEWGGNIFTYNTLKNKFIELNFNDFNIELNPIKSFFQLKNSVGVSAGLQHMTNSGVIASFQDWGAKNIYNSWTDIDTTSQEKRRESWGQQPYIGPATYDAQSDYLYFYANSGVFKGKSSTPLFKLSGWQLVFKPKLHWRNGQPDAVGSPMNVLKMLSLGNDKLVLLTQNDGVGIWDGSIFKLLH